MNKAEILNLPLYDNDECSVRTYLKEALSVMVEMEKGFPWGDCEWEQPLYKTFVENKVVEGDLYEDTLFDFDEKAAKKFIVELILEM
jgi:hypothetical protein